MLLLNSMKNCITCLRSLPEDSFYPGLNQCKKCSYIRAEERRRRLKLERKCDRCSNPIETGNDTGACKRCREKAKIDHKERYRSKHGVPKIEQLVEAAPPGTKYCSGCEEYLSLDAFYKWDDRRVSRCKKCKRSVTARRHDRLKTERRCLGCERPLKRKEKSLCRGCKTQAREKYHSNGDQNRAASRDRAFQLKLATFEAYGGCICKCCGETEPKFLTIDHVNGGGAEHRRSLGKSHGSGKNFYRWLKKNGYPPGFGVLCWNCNCAKGHFGICPHEVERNRAALEIAE